MAPPWRPRGPGRPPRLPPPTPPPASVFLYILICSALVSSTSPAGSTLVLVNIYSALCARPWQGGWRGYAHFILTSRQFLFFSPL